MKDFIVCKEVLSAFFVVFKPLLQIILKIVKKSFKILCTLNTLNYNLRSKMSLIGNYLMKSSRNNTST